MRRAPPRGKLSGQCHAGEFLRYYESRIAPFAEVVVGGTVRAGVRSIHYNKGMARYNTEVIYCESLIDPSKILEYHKKRGFFALAAANLDV